jgi:hypothetical protein
MLKYGAVYEGCVEGCVGPDIDQKQCRKICNCWVNEINRRGYANEYARSVFTGPTPSIMAKNVEIMGYCVGNVQALEEPEDSGDAASSPKISGDAVPSPKISVTAFSKNIDYGKVPSGFVPQIPNFDKAGSIVINMDKPNPHELVQIDVTKIPYRVSGFDPAAYSGEEFRIFEEDAANLKRNGQMAIQCLYSLSRSHNMVQSITFWYLTDPPKSTLESFGKRMPNHPFLKIKNSTSACPSTLEKALQASN